MAHPEVVPVSRPVWFCNKCGHVGTAETRENADVQHREKSPSCGYFPAWNWPAIVPVPLERPKWQLVSTYKLQLLGDAPLREYCDDFDPSADAPHLPALVLAMTTVLQRFAGYGLSAPQVGAGVRVIVARLEGGIRGPLVTMINPVITGRSFDTARMVEGCLSIPGFETHVLRHKRVTVRYLGDDFAPRTETVAGIPAQAVQHEIDHLDGMLIVDGLSDRRRAKAEELTAQVRARRT